MLTISRQTERLSIQLGRSPTLDELAQAAECSIEDVVEAIDAGRSYHPTSLDAPVAYEDEEDWGSLIDSLGREDDGYGLAEDRQAIASGWAVLNEVERQVLGLRLGHELTQREISCRVGCSQMHVSRLLRRSLLKLDQAAFAD